MLKGFKYRIYPDSEQQVLIDKHIDCVRFVYNLALETKISAYNGSKVSYSYNDLASQLTQLKSELTWLKEVNSQSLQFSLKTLDVSYINFFKGAGFPKFKKKDASRKSFHCPQNVTIDFNSRRIMLPKFNKAIPIELHRKFKGAIKDVAVSKTNTGKYFVSILVDSKIDNPTKREVDKTTAVGVDLGIKDFTILSDGTKIKHPKFLYKSALRLAYLQKSLSKKKKGSNRYKKAKHKLAKCHEKIDNQRNDFLHKESNEITNRFDTICMESLRVSNMMKNHKLARAIGDSSWSKFVGFVLYKSEHKGKNVLRLDTFEPSSKECSCCGYINKELTLSDRFWICQNCGATHDRDINAAVVIKNKCLGVAERTCQDAEVSPLCKVARPRRKRTVEASKVQNNMLPLVS